MCLGQDLCRVLWVCTYHPIPSQREINISEHRWDPRPKDRGCKGSRYASLSVDRTLTACNLFCHWEVSSSLTCLGLSQGLVPCICYSQLHAAVLDLWQSRSEACLSKQSASSQSWWWCPSGCLVCCFYRVTPFPLGRYQSLRQCMPSCFLFVCVCVLFF